MNILNIQHQGQVAIGQGLQVSNKPPSRAQSLSPQNQGVYRYQNPYFAKKKAISLKKRKYQLQIYLPPLQDRKQEYQLPPKPPHQPPPPTQPYSEGYYEARTRLEHRYGPTQGYEEVNYPIDKIISNT